MLEDSSPRPKIPELVVGFAVPEPGKLYVGDTIVQHCEHESTKDSCSLHFQDQPPKPVTMSEDKWTRAAEVRDAVGSNTYAA